jgi:hypothetical protein
MPNLTIAVEDDVLRRARIKALEQGTSVNALLRGYLEAYVGEGAQRRLAMRELLDLSRTSQSARAGRRWRREELHER